MAIDVYEQIKLYGLQPDEVLYNSLLDGCSKVADSKSIEHAQKI